MEIRVHSRFTRLCLANGYLISAQLLRAVLLTVAAFSMAVASACHASVAHLPQQNRWVLETNRTACVLGVDGDGRLRNLYWGAKLQDHDYRSGEFRARFEYPAWGGGLMHESCFKATFADGVRDVVFKYVSHDVREDGLTITLKDIGYDLWVDLVYRVHEGTDLIEKWSVIRNKSSRDVVLESAQSGVWHFPEGREYRLTHLAGRWGKETQVIREPVRQGKKILESRIGKTSHQENPWFAIDAEGLATENHGAVWFGALGWSGNWRLTFERDERDHVQVVGGYNPFDFEWPLKSGEQLKTPPFYGGYTGGGFGEASRLMHRLIRDEILSGGAHPELRRVMYNHWYSTTFDVSEASLRPVVEKAASLGVELFVMDDGWFGKRNDSKAGLGDWVPNPEKFPEGLGPLIRNVESHGMKFGIWVEPEMVNPDSDLYRSHPNWVINFPGRPRTLMRHQLQLNIARDEVREHLFQVLDTLLTENRIDYVKWDMNRYMSEPGWPEVAPGEQRKLYVKYIWNLYHLFDRLREKHPNVVWETCSGGGGRVDLGILERSEQAWTSDNTDPLDRLKIQEGFTFAYPPKAMMGWVTDVPNHMNGRVTSLEYRFLVSMMGSFGLSVNFDRHWTEEDLVQARQLIALYKQIRETVQHGDLFRLMSPREGSLTAAEYVSGDGSQVAVFVFLHSRQFGDRTLPVRLQGLDSDACYVVEREAGSKLPGKQRTFSGAYLENRGLSLDLGGDFDASLIVLKRQ